MNAGRSKLPPFGNQIDRDHDLVMIYCGARAWKLAKPDMPNRIASLVFPKNRDPSEFKWPVEGKNVLVFAQDEENSAVDLLTVELLRAGARIVNVRYSDGRLEIYDPAAERRKAP